MLFYGLPGSDQMHTAWQASLYAGKTISGTAGNAGIHTGWVLEQKGRKGAAPEPMDVQAIQVMLPSRVMTPGLILFPPENQPNKSNSYGKNDLLRTCSPEYFIEAPARQCICMPVHRIPAPDKCPPVCGIRSVTGIVR